MYQLAKSSNSNDPDARLVQLSDNQVPVQWKKLWSGPKAATNYLRAMSVRAVEAEKRLSQATTCPSLVDLSRIFNVDTFFAALKLIAARDYPEDISTTEIELRLRVGKGAATTKDDLNSIVLAPLLIEGGLNFDDTTGILTRVRANRENKGPDKTPELILVLSRSKSPAAVAADEDEEFTENECIVPLYSNGNRDKMIYSFKLPIEGNNLSTLAMYAALALIIPNVE